MYLVNYASIGGKIQHGGHNIIVVLHQVWYGPDLMVLVDSFGKHTIPIVDSSSYC